MTVLAETPAQAAGVPAEPRDLNVGRALAAAILYPFFGLGWLLGRGLLAVGWMAGRIWLILAFMAETAAFGFRQGAGLPARPEPDPEVTAQPSARPSRL